MNDSIKVRSKLELDDERIVVPLDEIVSIVSGIFENIGCSADVSLEVAEHWPMQIFAGWNRMG